MVFEKFMVTPGVQWPDGDFTPKPSPQDAEEAVEREGEGMSAYALMGFDLSCDRWEVLSVAYRHTTLVRRVNMMFKVGLEWEGGGAAEFSVQIDPVTVERAAVEAWVFFMDVCVKNGLNPADHEKWLASNAIRKLQDRSRHADRRIGQSRHPAR